MSTELFNERPFNAPDPPRTVVLCPATVLSIHTNVQRDWASTVSVSKNVQRNAVSGVTVRKEWLREYLTIVGVMHHRTQDAEAMLSVTRDCARNVATKVCVRRNTQSDYPTVIRLPHPVVLDTSVTLSVATRRVRDDTTIFSIGTHRAVNARTTIQTRRIRTRDFTVGVSIPGVHDQSVRSVVAVGRWRFLEAATVLYPKRNRNTVVDTQVRVDRLGTRNFSTDIFVGRRRFRLQDTAVSVGARRTAEARLYARIDRVRRRDAATGFQIDRSWFDTHLLDLLPSVYREQDTTGDLAAFLKIPAATLDDVKNRLDEFPSIFDVDNCDPAFLPLLAALLGWPLDPAGDTDTQRRALREAVEFYRRKGTIPAMVRSLENIGWQGRLFETFRGMLRTNRRARLNGLRLAGTVFNQGVYRVESDNIVPGVRQALTPHHPAGARVFFLQRMDDAKDAGQDAQAGFRHASRRGVFVSQHENFILNQNRANNPFPLTRKITARETAWLTRNLYAEQELTEAHDIVERWQRPIPGLALNHARLNWVDITNADRSELRLSLELDIDVKRNSEKITPLMLNKKHLNCAGLPQGSLYRWRFRQVEDKEETLAGLESAANEYLIRQWPAA